MKNAVQIGGGNIGRGLNGYVLSKNDFHITFLDVSQPTIDKMNSEDSYKVIQKGQNAGTDVVTNFDGLNIIKQVDKSVQAISNAAVVFISIGISNLKNLKDLFLKSFQKRIENKILAPINIVAVENGINATDTLKEIILEDTSEQIKEHIKQAVSFTNCAVDRIVPNQSSESLDVEVEPFFELVLDENTWAGPKLNEVKYSNSLSKFIQRKLFMLNATHAFIAWYGIQNKFTFIYEFVNNAEALRNVKKLLNNFVEILSAQFEFTSDELHIYAKKIITRLSNTEIKDEVTRVGRGVKRKVSNNDRFVSPIKYAQKHKVNYDAIIHCLAYAFSELDFDDAEVKEINDYINHKSLLNAIMHFTGLEEKVAKLIENEDKKI